MKAKIFQILSKVKTEPILLGTFILVAVACSTHIYDHFTAPKWLIFYFSSLILGGMLAGSYRQTILPISQWLYVVMGIVIGAYILSWMLNPSGFYEEHLLDWQAFAVIALAAYQLPQNATDFFKKLSQANLIAVILVTSYGLFQFYGVELFPSLLGNEFPSSTFGFQNMTAEFVGISILIQTYSLLVISSCFQRIGIILVLGISFAYLYLLSSRAMFLAVPIGLLPLLFIGGKNLWRIVLAGVLAIFIGYIFSISNPQSFVFNNAIVSAKKDNSNIRLIRWKNTLSMIKDKPFGIGPGRFEFGYIPYSNRIAQDPESNEDMVVKSPHNGYLEAYAEGGWIFGTAVMLLLLFMLYFLLKKWIAERSKECSLIFGLFLLLLVDAMFAFPMENAFPFYIAAIVLGWFLKHTVKKQATIEELGSDAGVGILLTPLFVLSIMFLQSKYFEANANPNKYYEDISLACDFLAPNWRACLKKAEIEMDFGTHDPEWYNFANDTTSKILERMPEHYSALWIQGKARMELGDIHGACESTTHYDELFQNQSRLHKTRLEICAMIK